MAEYIFYTTEGYTQAPDGEHIENCQLLGITCGNNKNEALYNLLKENSWIKERSFNPSKVTCKKLALDIK